MGPVIKAARHLGKQLIVENPVTVPKQAENLLYQKRKRKSSLLNETEVQALEKNNQYTYQFKAIRSRIALLFE